LEIGSGSFRALVTDINLDGKMDGCEVAQHAREIALTARRSLPVLPDQQTFSGSFGMSQKCRVEM
jgi:hypothetical protein